jgi:hypothetical protein
MRVLFAFLVLLALLPNYDGIAPMPLFSARTNMWVEPVSLDPARPQRTQVGALTFLGGIALKSHDPAFGGFSSLTVVGDRFTLLSDGGTFAQFRMDGDWRPRDIRFGNLPAGPGQGWAKEDRDSESMTRDPVTGDLWVGFENWNAIWRYAPDFARAEGAARPLAMRRWPYNLGPESLVRLRDAHFLTIAEGNRIDKARWREALVFAGDPTRDTRPLFRWFYVPPSGFNPSDATELPNGDILIINRRFDLPFRFTATLTIVKRTAIRPGAMVKGQPVATFIAPLIQDNFEGVAVTREGSATILWLVSDDNQSILQRSLLLKFRLDGAVE